MIRRLLPVLRSVFFLGLAGWAAIFAALSFVLLAAKLLAWPAVGWFVDDAGGFQGFGFLRDTEGLRETLGAGTLPIFAASGVVLAWLTLRGARAGVAEVRTALIMR